MRGRSKQQILGRIGLFCLLLAVSNHGIYGWVSSPFGFGDGVPTQRATTALFSTAATEAASVMGGVDDFDSWFSSQSGATCSPSVKHAAFGTLRGLTCDKDDIEGNKPLLTLPKNLVLKAPYSDPDWDSLLAQQLWKECLLASKSNVYGYCSLLTRGTPVTKTSCPPSTAPNALRHWTSDQKQSLETSESGRKLLELQQKQESMWKNKYSSVSDQLSWEQFQWALEVVHSRAFKGDFGQDSNNLIISAAVPVVAAAVGWFGVLRENPEPNNLLLIALAAIAAAPTVLNLVSPQAGDAVLLPLIDSANHVQEVDSRIEYDPIKGAFTLRVGPNCLISDSEKEQLYISYGQKKDTELLLNYGFLPGVPCDDGDDSTARDRQRRSLAEAFMKRN